MKHKTSKKGRPKTVRAVVTDRNDPDSYPSLIKFLESTGRVKHTTYAVMCQARNLFLRFVPTEEIAQQLRIKPAIVDRWALCFAWEEERDKRLFQRFRTIASSNTLFSEDINKRHERIAGGLEQVLEKMLVKHSNNELDLSPRDLSTIASTLKSTQEVRRVCRGVKRNESEDDGAKRLHVHVHAPKNMEKLAGVIVDSYERPKIAMAKTRTIAVGTESAISSDVEYETIDGQAEKGSSARSAD